MVAAVADHEDFYHTFFSVFLSRFIIFFLGFSRFSGPWLKFCENAVFRLILAFFGMLFHCFGVEIGVFSKFMFHSLCRTAFAVFPWRIYTNFTHLHHLFLHQCPTSAYTSWQIPPQKKLIYTILVYTTALYACRSLFLTGAGLSSCSACASFSIFSISSLASSYFRCV